MLPHSTQLQGHSQREGEFGEATIVAEQQLELQSALGSSPITSTQIKPSAEVLLPLFACCQCQQGAVQKQLSCAKTQPLLPKLQQNHKQNLGLGLFRCFFVENVISSLTCYLSKGRKHMREAVKNLPLKIKNHSASKVLF